MLDTVAIRDLLKKDKRTRTSFRGVFACDELPEQSPTSSLYIINTDPASRPGKHWVAVYITSQRYGEYFDSFGMHTTVERIESFLNKNCIRWQCNTKHVQDLLSDACGYHCIFYSVHRCIGFNLQAIINMYTNDSLCNDAIVKAFVRDYIIH